MLVRMYIIKFTKIVHVRIVFCSSFGRELPSFPDLRLSVTMHKLWNNLRKIVIVEFVWFSLIKTNFSFLIIRSYELYKNDAYKFIISLNSKWWNIWIFSLVIDNRMGLWKWRKFERNNWGTANRTTRINYRKLT